MRRTFLRCSLRQPRPSLGPRRFDDRCDRLPLGFRLHDAGCLPPVDLPVSQGGLRAIGGLPEAASFWPRGPLAWGMGTIGGERGPDPNGPYDPYAQLLYAAFAVRAKELGRLPPFSSCLLPRQDEAPGTRAVIDLQYEVARGRRRDGQDTDLSPCARGR